MQVRNQGYLRRKNKESIIALLREKEQSYSDLARALKLSNTAIGKIADDLIGQNIVRREGDMKGRTGINLSINADLGYVVAIDLSGRQINYCAADFGSNILIRRDIGEVISFRPSDLERLIAAVRELVSDSALADKKLYSIAIASPGKIDRASGKFILNPRFKGFENISLKEVFEREFRCRVIVKNDINLALEGEKMYGAALRGVRNALMLHVDVGTGAAFLIDGKVYEGSHGFAGEIGFFKLNMLQNEPNNFGNLSYSNYFDSTSLFAALGVVKREVMEGRDCVISGWLSELGAGWDDITIQMLVKAYQAGDPLVAEVINSAGRVIGAVAGSIADLLDIDLILLNGSVVGFGKPYLECFSESANGYPAAYSDLMENASIMGAVNAGILASFEAML